LDDPLYGQTNLSAGQAVVTGMMRAVLFDWLSEVHNSGSAPAALNGESDPQEMLFRTFSHVDAYLSRQAVHRSELQLTGVACTLAAAIVHGKEDAEDSSRHNGKIQGGHRGRQTCHHPLLGCLVTSEQEFHSGVQGRC